MKRTRTFKNLIKWIRDSVGRIADNKKVPDDEQSRELSRLFGEISQEELEELKEHDARMESEDWADKTQAFIDNHDDIERARAARKWAEMEGTVYHLLRKEVMKRADPRSFTMEDARQMVAKRVKYDVPDEVIWQQYNRLFDDLSI